MVGLQTSELNSIIDAFGNSDKTYIQTELLLEILKKN